MGNPLDTALINVKGNLSIFFFSLFFLFMFHLYMQPFRLHTISTYMILPTVIAHIYLFPRRFPGQIVPAPCHGEIYVSSLEL